MVMMVPWKVKCVMVPAGQMLLLVGLSSPEFVPVTVPLALCSHQNSRTSRTPATTGSLDSLIGGRLCPGPLSNRQQTCHDCRLR